MGNKVVSSSRSFASVVKSNVPRRSGGRPPLTVNPLFAGRVPARAALSSSPPRSSSQRNRRPPLLNTRPLFHSDTAHLKVARCSNCSEPGHNVTKCRFAQPLVCFRCKQYGHKVKHCILDPNTCAPSFPGQGMRPRPLFAPRNGGDGIFMCTNGGQGQVMYGNNSGIVYGGR